MAVFTSKPCRAGKLTKKSNQSLNETHLSVLAGKGDWHGDGVFVQGVQKKVKGTEMLEK